MKIIMEVGDMLEVNTPTGNIRIAVGIEMLVDDSDEVPENEKHQFPRTLIQTVAGHGGYPGGHRDDGRPRTEPCRMEIVPGHSEGPMNSNTIYRAEHSVGFPDHVPQTIVDFYRVDRELRDERESAGWPD